MKDTYQMGNTSKVFALIVGALAILANIMLVVTRVIPRLNGIGADSKFEEIFIYVGLALTVVSIAYYAVFTVVKKQFMLATIYNALALIGLAAITAVNYSDIGLFEDVFVEVAVGMAIVFFCQLIAFKKKSVLMALASLYISVAPGLGLFVDEPFGLQRQSVVWLFNITCVALINTVYVISVKSQIKKAKKSQQAELAQVVIGAPGQSGGAALAQAVVQPDVQAASQPQAYSPMGFIASESFVIDEKITSTTKSFNVYSATGVQVGFIRENISGGAKAARVAMGKSAAAFQAAEYLVCDMSGNILMKIHKEGGFATPDIQNAYGQKLASLERGYIKTATGEKIGKFSKGLSNTIKVLDNLGNIMCTAEKKFQGAKTIFTSADKYKVTIDPSITGNNRLIALGVVLTYEMILGNK